MTEQGGGRRDGFVTGPHRVDQLHSGMCEELVALWMRVNAAGGGVGFTPESAESEVRLRAEQVLEQVREGQVRMLVIGQQHELVGVVFLVPGSSPLVAHRAKVSRLMVDPELHGRGWGRQLMQAVVAQAQAIGLRRLFLSARDSAGVAGFYRRLGWTQYGTLPDAVRIGEDAFSDEILFTLAL